MIDKKENPLLSLGFNIILPVFILNQGQNFFPAETAPLYALIIALAFPFGYGLKDLIIRKKLNAISSIGLVSIALTGGLALFQFQGIYFAIKEASIPLILAFVAWASIFFKKPLASLLIFKSSLFDTALIKSRLKAHNREKDFRQVMNISTWALGGSFVLSAILNFVIAFFVFAEKPFMGEDQKRQMINEQVADMTWMGYVFIALPLTFITGFLLLWILKRLKNLTGLSLNELIPQIKKEL